MATLEYTPTLKKQTGPASRVGFSSRARKAPADSTPRGITEASNDNPRRFDRVLPRRSSAIDYLRACSAPLIRPAPLQVARAYEAAVSILVVVYDVSKHREGSRHRPSQKGYH